MQKLDGARLVLESEPRYRLLDEVKIRCSRKAPLLLEYKIKPIHGLKIKAFADPLGKVRARGRARVPLVAWGCVRCCELNIRCAGTCGRGVLCTLTVTPEWLQVVSGEVELQAAQDGMKIELQNFVTSAGWAKPRVQIGFRF